MAPQNEFFLFFFLKRWSHQKNENNVRLKIQLTKYNLNDYIKSVSLYRISKLRRNLRIWVQNSMKWLKNYLSVELPLSNWDDTQTSLTFNYFDRTCYVVSSKFKKTYFFFSLWNYILKTSTSSCKQKIENQKKECWYVQNTYSNSKPNAKQASKTMPTNVSTGFIFHSFASNKRNRRKKFFDGNFPQNLLKF